MYCTVIVGFDALRMWLGPCPYYVCRFMVTIKMVLINMFIFILLSIVINKFMFICIWKKMRNMNDQLVTSIVIRCCFAISLVFALIRATVSEKLSFLMVSCINSHKFVLKKNYIPGLFLKQRDDKSFSKKICVICLQF